MHFCFFGKYGLGTILRKYVSLYCFIIFFVPRLFLKSEKSASPSHRQRAIPAPPPSPFPPLSDTPLPAVGIAHIARGTGLAKGRLDRILRSKKT